jgi:hypothetical protein
MDEGAYRSSQLLQIGGQGLGSRRDNLAHTERRRLHKRVKYHFLGAIRTMHRTRHNILGFAEESLASY